MRAFAEAGATDFAPVELALEPRRRRRRRASCSRAWPPTASADGRTSTAPSTSLGGAVRAAGIVELEPTERGIVLHRMPAWARAQHNDIALPMLETMPSGGRLEMVTDATTIELDVHLTLVQLGTEPGPPAAFDLVVDGELVGGRVHAHGHAHRDRPIHRRGRHPARRTRPRSASTGCPPGEKHVEVWLPNAAAVHLHRAARRRRGAAARRRAARGGGCTTAAPSPTASRPTRPTGVWPVVAARLAGVDLPELRLRRAVPARSVRGPDDRPAAGRPHQPQARHQHRERRLDARAHLRARRPRLPRPGARPPPRRPAGGDHADHLPGGRGPPRSHRRRRRTGSARSPSARPPSPSAPSPCGGSGSSRPRSSRPGRPPATPTSTCSRGPTCSGPTTWATSPTASTRTPAGYQRMGERFHALAFQGDGPFAG